jgi:hypothetical protein
MPELTRRRNLEAADELLAHHHRRRGKGSLYSMKNGSSVTPDWSRKFDDPIVLPDGRKLVTLLDAATYATKLPKKEADTAAWQAAIESLMLLAELRGPTMFARIGVMRALNRHVERVFDPSRKDHLWGRRKLKRDE